MRSAEALTEAAAETLNPYELPHALLRCPKFLCALERHRNFDRYAISPSFYLPPAVVRLNAQSKRATKLRHASLCNFQLSVVYINLLFLSTDYGKFKTDVFTFRTHLFSSFIQSLFLSENFCNFIRGAFKLICNVSQLFSDADALGTVAFTFSATDTG